MDGDPICCIELDNHNSVDGDILSCVELDNLSSADPLLAVEKFEQVRGTYHNWWLLPAMAALAGNDGVPRQLQYLDGCVTSYGSDCSGAEAPFHALRAVEAELQSHGVQWSIRHVFSSEAPGREGTRLSYTEFLLLSVSLLKLSVLLMKFRVGSF